ncbi:hypothetical protein QUF90_05630 [Desulfococcaceae bacterium HSG9]|nr:hypothetical protein [Desulfococcaceae bacterium HSG9]
MMKKLFVLIMALLTGVIFSSSAFAEVTPLPSNIDFAFSPNPVGSGARALGWSAFIAVADDATAASWNPGALIQLKYPEASIVGDWFYRYEDNTFGDHPEADGSNDVSEADLNYLSLAYPFRLFNRNMIVSLNYQRLYDFTRKLSYKFNAQPTDIEGNPIPNFYTFDDINQQQSGSLSAIGLAYGFEIIPRILSFGFTWNIWDDDLCNNKWEQKYGGSTVVKMGDISVGGYSYSTRHKFTFDGHNFNLGVLWRSRDSKLSLGAVFKSQFTADLKHEFHGEQTGYEPNDIITDDKIKMPMSYGMGIAYRFSDSFTVAGDIYRTHWEDFIIEEDGGIERSAVTAKPIDESDVDPTVQLRIGAEYLFIDKTADYVIPLT